MAIAVITGASSGLGREYALSVKKRFPEIDEIWLIARRKNRLEELARELDGIKTVILNLDLTDKQSFEIYNKKLQDRNSEIKILINNSGFGKLGYFNEIDWEWQSKMISLNNDALTIMTYMTLPYMKKGSFIIQVCSIAAFVPTPRMAVYCSTKAFVLSFSKALRQELKPKGINVLAACPGPMSTEFLENADIPKGRSKVFDTLPRVSQKTMAEKSLKAASKKKAVYTNKIFYKVYRVLSKILPHNFLMHFTTT